MDVGAIERLAQRMQRSRAQEATITKQTAEHDGLDLPRRDSHGLSPGRHPQDRVTDENGIVRDPRNSDTEHSKSRIPGPVPQTTRDKERAPIDIREANPSEVHLTVVDHGDTQIAYSNVYDLQGHTGEPTHALFGGWQTDKTLGYVVAVENQGHTQTYISTEDRGDQDIQTALTDRIGQVIQRSHAQHANASPRADPTDRATTPGPEQESERQAELPVELQPGEPAIEPEIQQIIQEQQDRQQAWEHGIAPDQDNDLDNDLGFGIE
jgi:hypothetical protein